MFAIAVDEQQYTTYLLSDSEAQSQVSVVPERGGILISWLIQGQEIFYLDQERYKDPTLSVRGGNPLLFPICGNLPDDQYTTNGQTYTLKQHGFARSMPWTVTNQSTENGSSVTVSLKSTPETLPTYPFDFEIAYTYTLRGNQLEMHQAHTNHSAQPMPFSTGIHPYFAAPDKTQLQFDIPATAFQAKGDDQTQPFNGTFDFEQEEIDVAFTDLSRQSAIVVDNSQSQKLILDYDAHYSTLVFWTQKGKPFYCLEPWSAPRNAMNTGTHLLHVEPGATLQTYLRMTVER